MGLQSDWPIKFLEISDSLTGRPHSLLLLVQNSSHISWCGWGVCICIHDQAICWGVGWVGGGWVWTLAAGALLGINGRGHSDREIFWLMVESKVGGYIAVTIFLCCLDAWMQKPTYKNRDNNLYQIGHPKHKCTWHIGPNFWIHLLGLKEKKREIEKSSQ